MKYVKGDVLKCPHCDKESYDRDPVEDFVVPMRIGSKSVERCEYCDKVFTVCEYEQGKFEVLGK